MTPEYVINGLKNQKAKLIDFLVHLLESMEDSYTLEYFKEPVTWVACQHTIEKDIADNMLREAEAATGNTSDDKDHSARCIVCACPVSSKSTAPAYIQNRIFKTIIGELMATFPELRLQQYQTTSVGGNTVIPVQDVVTARDFMTDLVERALTIDEYKRELLAPFLVTNSTEAANSVTPATLGGHRNGFLTEQRIDDRVEPFALPLLFLTSQPPGLLKRGGRQDPLRPRSLCCVVESSDQLFKLLETLSLAPHTRTHRTTAMMVDGSPYTIDLRTYVEDFDVTKYDAVLAFLPEKKDIKNKEMNAWLKGHIKSKECYKALYTFAPIDKTYRDSDITFEKFNSKDMLMRPTLLMKQKDYLAYLQQLFLLATQDKKPAPTPPSLKLV